MAKTVANPNPVSVISRASECMRRLMEAGVTFEDLQIPIDYPHIRFRLAEYWHGKAPMPTPEHTTASIRKVILKFENDSHLSEYIVAANELATFKEATLTLHHDPGLNPHNKETTSELASFRVYELREEGPFWWTTPDLQINKDPAGAKIMQWVEIPEEAWTRPLG